jgi:hypothetical protein
MGTPEHRGVAEFRNRLRDRFAALLAADDRQHVAALERFAEPSNRGAERGMPLPRLAGFSVIGWRSVFRLGMEHGCEDPEEEAP